MFRKIWSKHKHKAVAVGTAAGTAGVMYAVWQSAFIFLVMTVLASHEFGHWLAAYQAGADTGYVLFLPLIFLMIGATQIKNVPDIAKAKVAISGPIAGIIASLSILFGVLMLGLQYLLVPSMILAAFEFLNLVIGSDASKYREAKRNANVNDSRISIPVPA